ncbi:MAG: N-acetyltransferase, partial [Lachnospiraceae bacterium]|nr:N-acetyltransferase [Lachnospiraceae bacterium]
MEYRLAREDDIDEIVLLINKAIIEMEKNGIHQWDERYPTRGDFLEDIIKKTLYMVFDDGVFVAIYAISSECDEAYHSVEWQGKDKSTYILHRFCVSPDFQNRGIGKAVLSHIEAQVQAMGYETIRLDAFTQNPYALNLYHHNGYITRGYAHWRKGCF